MGYVRPSLKSGGRGEEERRERRQKGRKKRKEKRKTAKQKEPKLTQFLFQTPCKSRSKAATAAPAKGPVGEGAAAKPDTLSSAFTR